MKSFFAVVLVVALAAGGYYFYLQNPALHPTAAAPKLAPVPPVVAEAPESLAAPPPPPVAMKHLAPKGVYFLLQSVSITTDSGITGVIEGTKVNVVNNTGKTWRMTDGENQFDVAPERLTNDLDVAAAIIKRDEEADAARDASIRNQQDNARKIRDQGAAWLASQLEQQHQQQATHPSQTGTANQPPATSVNEAPGGPSSPFGRPQP